MTSPPAPAGGALVRGYLVAARPAYYPGAPVLYALGALLGAGPIVPWRFALGMVVVTLVHVITHYVNDAEDVATDEVTENPSFATGGSRAIQRGLVTPAQLLGASAALSALVLGACALLALAGHPREAAVDLAMLALGYAYSGRPFTLGRRLLGELDAALVMGALLPLAGSYAAGGPGPATWPLAAVLFAQTLLGRLSTAYPDHEADRSTGKWTITALLGPRRSAAAFVGAGLLLALAAEAAAPALPSPLVMRASVWITALASLALALLVGSGWASGKRAVAVPVVALGAYAVSLTAMCAAVLLPALR